MPACDLIPAGDPGGVLGWPARVARPATTARARRGANSISLDFSWPGTLTDNVFIEAFNGRFRAECLNIHWFLTLADAGEKLEARAGTTTRIAHRAIGNKPPISLMSLDGAAGRPS